MAKEKRTKKKLKGWDKEDSIRLRGPFDAHILEVEQEDRDDGLVQHNITVQFTEPVNSLTTQVIFDAQDEKEKV